MATTTYTPTKKGKKQISGGILFSTDSDGNLALSEQIWDEKKQRKLSELGFISSDATITITEVTQPLIDADDSPYSQEQLGLWDIKGAADTFIVASSENEVVDYTTRKDGDDEDKVIYSKSEIVPSISYIDERVSTLYTPKGSANLITLLSKDLNKEALGNVYNISSLGLKNEKFFLDATAGDDTTTNSYVTASDDSQLRTMYDATQSTLTLKVNDSYSLVFGVLSLDTTKTPNEGKIDLSFANVVTTATDDDKYINDSNVYIGDNLVCCTQTGSSNKIWDNLHGIIGSVTTAKWAASDYPF